MRKCTEVARVSGTSRGLHLFGLQARSKPVRLGQFGVVGFN